MLGVLHSSQHDQAGGLNAKNWPRVLVSLGVIYEGKPTVLPNKEETESVGVSTEETVTKHGLLHSRRLLNSRVKSSLSLIKI